GGMLLSMVGGEAAMTGLIADGIGGRIGGGILSTLAGLVMARAHREKGPAGGYLQRRVSFETRNGRCCTLNCCIILSF
ncbi:hypothetical protein ACC811_37435, partial [Rhizobium ruizarguesonis]